MDLHNPIIQLCLEGTRAEFEHRNADANDFYQQAWDTHRDAYEACIAAHYLARFQDEPAKKLYWNQVALSQANSVADERVKDFYPSLYLNLGQSHELLGQEIEAQRYYNLAAELGFAHQK